MSDDLNELFSRDPQGYSEQDIDKIVARMREAQANFELGLRTPKEPKPKKASEKLLKDLGLA